MGQPSAELVPALEVLAPFLLGRAVLLGPDLYFRAYYDNFSVDECVERLHETIKWWTEESWSCAVTYTVSGTTIHTYSSRYSFQATSRKGDLQIRIIP